MIESTWRFRGWVQVVMASAAMVATLPGRTHGLGLITEPLLNELNLDRVTFANINLAATLIGALFCFPAGRLLDRFGSRVMLTTVLVALAAAVFGITAATSLVTLLMFVTLTRGFGQSALSVVSISMVGRWFDRRLALATTIYSVLLSVGFMVSFGIVGSVIRDQGWRTAWYGIGAGLLLIAVFSALLVRHRPAAASGRDDTSTTESHDGFTLVAALRTPAFWTFAVATSLFGLISSGLSLFNQAILAERGFDAKTYHNTLVLSTFVGLGGQLLGGWLAQRFSFGKLLALAMAIYATALVALTTIHTLTEVRACASLLGLAGGMITVIFFAIWAHAFGRRELGRIQGTAQMLTVFASAVGPLVLARCHEQFGTFSPVLYGLAGCSVVLAIIAVATPLPRWQDEPDSSSPASITVPPRILNEPKSV
jgi:MFS family permease